MHGEFNLVRWVRPVEGAGGSIGRCNAFSEGGRRWGSGREMPPYRADESDEVASLCVGSSTEAPFRDKDAADEGGHCQEGERDGDDRPSRVHPGEFRTPDRA